MGEWYEFDDEPGPDESAEARKEYELVPDGVHEFAIKHQENGDGVLKLRLSHTDSRYGMVFCDMYARRKKDGLPNKKTKGLCRELAAALGLTGAEWAAAVRAGDLVDGRVRARTRQWQPDSGRTKVQVDEFLPLEQAAPVVERAVAPPADRAPVTKPPRTKAAKADAASATVPDDDIPF